MAKAIGSLTLAQLTSLLLNLAELIICIAYRGSPGAESQDYGYKFTNSRRRSNSSSHGHDINGFKTKFEHIEADPVFEEEYGPSKEDMEELTQEKSESADSISTASVEEEEELAKK